MSWLMPAAERRLFPDCSLSSLQAGVSDQPLRPPSAVSDTAGTGPAPQARTEQVFSVADPGDAPSAACTSHPLTFFCRGIQAESASGSHPGAVLSLNRGHPAGTSHLVPPACFFSTSPAQSVRRILLQSCPDRAAARHRPQRKTAPVAPPGAPELLEHQYMRCLTAVMNSWSIPDTGKPFRVVYANSKLRSCSQPGMETGTDTALYLFWPSKL